MNIKDHTEFEAKFYPVNKEEYRAKLLKLGAKLKISERKMVRVAADGYANHNLPKNTFVRVRNEGEIIRLSLKISADADGNISDQKEVDVEVSDFDKTVKILEATGIIFNKHQETLREEWEYKGAEITIDTWPGLTTYSEIEASSEDEVKSIANDLGFDWGKKIITGAIEVYCKVYGLTKDEASKKISNITFQNNPFEDTAKVWDPKTQQEG